MKIQKETILLCTILLNKIRCKILVVYDIRNYILKCGACQRAGKSAQAGLQPLILVLLLAPFEKWSIYFVGSKYPTICWTKKRYILVATNYATKMVKATKLNDVNTVAKFLFENIITCYGCHLELVSDRGLYFLNTTIKLLIERIVFFIQL